jgi:PAS domain S-box-containing protein
VGTLDDDSPSRSVAPQNARSMPHARQQAEEALARTREAVRATQERLAARTTVGTGTVRWDIPTNVVEWDGNVDRLFGLDSNHAGHSFEALFEAMHPDDRAGAIERLEHSARDGSDVDMEFRVVWPCGEVHWINARASAVFDDQGRTLYMTGVCADVTDRKILEEASRENEERLRAIFNHAAVGIAVAAADGRFLDMNARFSQILGYSEAELRGLTFSDITHPDDRADTLASASQLLAGTIPEYSIEKRYVRKDGSTLWIRATVTLLGDATGLPQRFIGVVEDITPRKRAEAALREETRILELLNETGQSIASQLDLRAVVQEATDAATQLSGAQFGAFVYNVAGEEGEAFQLYALAGASWEAFEQFGDPHAAALFGLTLRGHATIRCDDVSEDARFGSTAPFSGLSPTHQPARSYLAVPVRSRSGDVMGGLFFGHSQTSVFTERAERLVVGVAAQAGVALDNARLYEAAQHAAEERKNLLESERAARTAAERLSDVKDEFLATLSHELRTPLNAILGWSQVLRGGGRDDADYLKGLETIERNARIQTQLIEDLLDMSRITSGKLRLDIQSLQPVSFIEAALETVRPAAEAKGIRLEQFLDPAAGPISGDPSRLQQIVWNLLSNAIKFTPREGKVQILLERVNSHVEISVADTGVGIRPELIPHLFERFRQGDASTTRQYGGLGLGLSIVKSLVELHGGNVWVRSKGEGHGTTVTVHLPLTVVQRDEDGERVHPRSPGASSGPAGAAELAGLTVLIVDDQADARDLVRRVLEDCGAEVLTADGADTALALVAARRPDVLVSDIGMPGADGFELLRRVRALGADRGGRIPAIALTALARSQDRTRALRAGLLVHVSKPVDPSELVATVASVSGRVDET